MQLLLHWHQGDVHGMSLSSVEKLSVMFTILSAAGSATDIGQDVPSHKTCACIPLHNLLHRSGYWP